MKYEAILQRLLTEYGLYPDLEITEDFEVRLTREKVETIKQELSALGPVNPGAIEEFKEVAQRHDFLTEQRNDFLEAKNTLHEAMSEMDNEMTMRFSTTFNAVQNRFRQVFKEMFGGGDADLVLTQPDNLLETGVDIVARPPGKKLQNLSLLSGGERALTAIALLFSIIEVRPVPFCILDEVESALDEANVMRYSKYLKKFSEKTQFIVITHRKGTMEGADVLYGITMQESGVSKLISVKLSEVPRRSDIMIKERIILSFFKKIKEKITGTNEAVTEKFKDGLSKTRDHSRQKLMILLRVSGKLMKSFLKNSKSYYCKRMLVLKR